MHQCSRDLWAHPCRGIAQSPESRPVRAGGGVGLGLYLTKLQVEQLKGSIQVTSPSGCRFCLTIPLERAPAQCAEPSPPPRAAMPTFAAGVHVLVADDMRLNRRVLHKAFVSHFGSGWVVTETSTAEATLAALAPGHGFALLVIDEIFSDVDDLLRGSAAISLIREREAAEGMPRLPIISCTGNAAYDAERILACGADLVWNKPFPSFVDGSMQRDVARVAGSVLAR